MIRLQNVSYESGRGRVNNLSFHLPNGETAVVLGPQNSGKTGFWQTCVGMQPFITGEVRLMGRVMDPFGQRISAESAQMVGIATQHTTLLDNLTVAANIGLPLSYHVGLSEREMMRRVTPMLEKFGIRPLAGKFPHEISDTDVKMAMMARATILGQKLLVLDEPTAGDIDPESFMRIVNVISRFRDEMQEHRQRSGDERRAEPRALLAMLILTTSPSLASIRGAACYYLVNGALIPHAKVAEANDPAAVEFFAGIRKYTDRQSGEISGFYRTIFHSGQNAG
jgi:ABC-type transporter Mla maintaining outer membrane lipid asymmetry ATPase subunit MlaF